MNAQDLDAITEQLTAYLDGELSSEEAAAVEARLVDDESLRLRLADLRKSYDLLDELPETPFDQRFTRSTLELVVKELSNSKELATVPSSNPSVVDLKPQRDWWAWPRILLTIGGLVFIGLLLGFLMRFNQIRQDIRDLGLIANLPGLMDVNDVNIAISLSKETQAMGILKEQLKERLVPPIPSSIWQRKNWMDSLSPLHFAKLDSGREILRKLDRDSYNRFASMETKIEQSPDSDAVQDAIHLTGLVMDSLPNTKRLDLDAMNPEQRFQFLKEQIYLSAAMYYAVRLTSEDTKALDEWEDAYFHPAIARDLQSPRGIEKRTLLSMLWFRRSVENGYELVDQEDVVAALLPNLSKTGRELLEGVGRRDQLGVLITWLAPNRVASSKSIIEEYDRIPREARERIDLNDPQQTRRQVEEILRRPNNRGKRP